jgi:hypothetical protein
MWDGNSWSAPQGLTSLTLPINCVASYQGALYIADGNSNVLQANGNSYTTLITGGGNPVHYVESLTTIGNNLYLGFYYSYGNDNLTSGKLYHDTVLTNILDGGDD